MCCVCAEETSFKFGNSILKENKILNSYLTSRVITQKMIKCFGGPTIIMRSSLTNNLHILRIKDK